jgi:RNA-directed DNA polymerase
MLSHELYIKAKDKLYEKFTVPKRYGGTREIWAPNKDLKLVQHRVANLLGHCIKEIGAPVGHADEKSKSGVAHGFKRGRSIFTAARPHATRKLVFNVDLADFFGTINFGRVRGFFIASKHFALHPKVATVLAQIACHDNKLPQGSPCSPVISNLIGHSLDMLLVQLSKATGCTYTRYADDLTFSSNKEKFSSRVAYLSDPAVHKWEAGHGLKRALKRAGFTLNDRKTRMQYCDSRQTVTGLTVNRKPNVPATYRNMVRAMAHSLFRSGTFDIAGQVIDGNGIKTPVKTPGKVAQLVGMLAYIDFVDHQNYKLREENKLAPIDTTGRLALFRRVLYFDYFYAPSMPVLICEGKTDNVYIRCAIKSLAASYPSLATPGSPPKLKLRLFKYAERRTHHVTQLKGGVNGLCKLMKNYHEDVSQKFKAPPPAHPVIILIDNDSGSKNVYGAVAGVTGKHKPTGTEQFVHVTSNLYLVATPLGPSGAQTKIEDFFTLPTLGTLLGGKPFDPSNDGDGSTSYGKAAFARDVVAKNADNINFTGFVGLLDRIAAVIDDYALKLSVAALSTAPSPAPVTAPAAPPAMT